MTSPFGGSPTKLPMLAYSVPLYDRPEPVQAGGQLGG
jgi:hypothetical protein